MKYCLIDYTNHGIIFVHDSFNSNKLRWDFTILKSCILDTLISSVSKDYPYLNQNFIKQKLVYQNKGSYLIGNDGEMNETFFKKIEKAELIFPLITNMTQGLIDNSIKYIPEFYIPIDDTIAYNLSQCKPEQNFYSVGVIRYGQMVGMSPEEAYRELALEVESTHALKMRVYSVAKKYENLIREVTTKEQADILAEEIQQKLFRECFI